MKLRRVIFMGAAFAVFVMPAGQGLVAQLHLGDAAGSRCRANAGLQLHGDACRLYGLDLWRPAGANSGLTGYQRVRRR